MEFLNYSAAIARNLGSSLNRGGVIVYYVRHRVGTGAVCLASKDILTFQLTTYIYFLKEDYYV